jgi:hypothetical protein
MFVIPYIETNNLVFSSAISKNIDSFYYNFFKTESNISLEFYPK